MPVTLTFPDWFNPNGPDAEVARAVRALWVEEGNRRLEEAAADCWADEYPEPISPDDEAIDFSSLFVDEPGETPTAVLPVHELPPSVRP